MRLAEAIGAAGVLALLLCSATAFAQGDDDDDDENTSGDEAGDDKPAGAGDENAAIGAYFDELERTGLLDVESGTRTALTEAVGAAEELLSDGSSAMAAVALYKIVESPVFRDLDEYVEYHNAEYYLGVALARSGAYDSALVYLSRAIARGPRSLYFAPAHRRAVDIAIDTRAYQQVLDLLDDIVLAEPLAPGPVGERAYLRARLAYNAKDFAAAEGELARISRKSRLYSSALYLRSVINTRSGQLKDAAAALCEIADTPDSNRFTFVVDDRYFRIKDLARLGLGRLAHEVSEYDDAYYHYFQIPEDSDRLPEALFEASWTMYQKRELGTARDLATEFAKTFPISPLWPEAQLLAGYIELADCEFDSAQKHYDGLVENLEPILARLKKTVDSPSDRDALFGRALENRRAERADPQKRVARDTKTISDRVLGLLALDPEYVRLHDAMTGLRASKGQAALAVKQWSRLGRRLSQNKVGAVAEEDSSTDDATLFSEIALDARRLEDEVASARAALRRAVREGTIEKSDADAEVARLAGLDDEIGQLEKAALAAAFAAEEKAAEGAPPALKPMVERDLAAARALEREANELETVLQGEADRIAQAATERLYKEVRRVYDKAKLGKIDAVIGQKRRLEIDVQDLASGRFPPELFGQLWEKGLIGDDEELWPFEGEFWADEYERFR